MISAIWPHVNCFMVMVARPACCFGGSSARSYMHAPCLAHFAGHLHDLILGGSGVQGLIAGAQEGATSQEVVGS